MYKIKKSTNEKTTQWNVFFEFKKSKAEVEITHDEGNLDLYLVSKTDGFHWFEFLMAQEPNCKKLRFEERNDYLLAKNEVKKLFEQNGFIYRPEDKESCFLNGISPYTDDQMETISKLIDERFANRERFF